MDKNERVPRPRYFSVGETVCYDGIYRAYHNSHRTSHEVTLIAGETFPPCVQCGFDVHFELLREVAEDVRDLDFSFRIHLYQIPHPPAEEADEERKTA